MTDPYTPLSTAGLRKREQILALALRASSRRRHRRLVVRCALGCAVIAGALSLFLRIEHGAAPAPIQVHVVEPIPPKPIPVPTPAPSPVPLHRDHQIVITRIQTDPRMTSQLAVRPAGESIQRIDDGQLLDQLAVARQPAGLARVGGKTLLLFRNSPHSIHRPE